MGYILWVPNTIYDLLWILSCSMHYRIMMVRAIMRLWNLTITCNQLCRYGWNQQRREIVFWKDHITNVCQNHIQHLKCYTLRIHIGAPTLCCLLLRTTGWTGFTYWWPHTNNGLASSDGLNITSYPHPHMLFRGDTIYMYCNNTGSPGSGSSEMFFDSPTKPKSILIGS